MRRYCFFIRRQSDPHPEGLGPRYYLQSNSYKYTFIYERSIQCFDEQMSWRKASGKNNPGIDYLTIRLVEKIFGFLTGSLHQGFFYADSSHYTAQAVNYYK